MRALNTSNPSSHISTDFTLNSPSPFTAAFVQHLNMVYTLIALLEYSHMMYTLTALLEYIIRKITRRCTV